MPDAMSRIEVDKVAWELGTSADELAFLAASGVDELRALRTTIREGLHARHADLVARLAALSRLLPVGLSAKMAENAFGPVLSARVAGALDPKDAAKLAGSLDRDFLARLAAHLDPADVGPLVEVLPADLMDDIGGRLLAAGEHLALARFLAVVDTDLALRIVAGADPVALLRIALLSEDPVALGAIVERLDDATVEQVRGAAAGTVDHDAAVALLSPP